MKYCTTCRLERGEIVERHVGHECMQACEQPLKKGGRCESMRECTAASEMVTIRGACGNVREHLNA